MNATGAIGQTRAKRVAIILVAAAATAGPSIATAQAWSVQSGATGRGEYTDNYFFTAENPQSAFTASISPFITAARRTENDEIAALLAVGANRVWGPSPTTDYLSGRFALNASARQVRSTWAGNISIMRAPSLQDELTPSGSILALAYVDNAAVNGSYAYELTELWSLGVNAGGYGNRYENVEGGGTQPNNHGYSVGATTRYAFSDRTPLTFSVSYSYFSSEPHPQRVGDPHAWHRAPVLAQPDDLGHGRRLLDDNRGRASSDRLPHYAWFLHQHHNRRDASQLWTIVWRKHHLRLFRANAA